MKKILSLVLVSALVLGLLAVIPVVSFAKEEAPDATPVSSATDFASMASDGSYYLTADITVSASYQATFTGKFDGKGFKITTSVPLFETFAGTATDFVIEGAVVTSADRGGVFANTIGNSNISKIINKASLTGSAEKVTGTDDLELNGVYGAICGTSLKKSNVTISDCENYGTVSGYNAGGLVGKSHAQPFTMTNCRNYGDVTGGDCGGGIMAWGWGDFTLENCVNGSETVKPVIKSSTETTAGIVSYISGSTNAILIGCANYGTLNNLGSGGAAGLVGRSGDKSGLIMRECVNYGAVNGTNGYAGGMLGSFGKSATMEFTGCVNRADVISTLDSAGGIAGGIGASSETVATGCVNYGKVTSGAYDAGGIFGESRGTNNITYCFNYGEIHGCKKGGGIVANMGHSDTTGESLIEYCGNEGKIFTEKDTASGIIAYANTSASRVIKTHFCYNTADVASGLEAGGIVGYTNNCEAQEVKYCFNTGKITTSAEGEVALALYYHNGANEIPAANVVGNFYLKDCATKEAKASKDVFIDMKSTLTADDFASGKVCYELNKAIGSDLFYQTIGTDPHPVLDDTHGTVYLVGGEYSNSENPDTSDGAIIVYVVAAVVAALGMAIVVSRKVRA